MYYARQPSRVADIFLPTPLFPKFVCDSKQRGGVGGFGFRGKGKVGQKAMGSQPACEVRIKEP